MELMNDVNGSPTRIVDAHKLPEKVLLPVEKAAGITMKEYELKVYAGEVDLI